MSELVESHISKRFEIKRRIGKGSYGIVWRAHDRKLNKVVALKKIFDAFHNKTDAQRTFREIEILRQLDKHENIVSLLDVVGGLEDSKDIYLIFEFMETDLHKIIQKGNILKQVHKGYIVYQILKAIKFLHSGNIIHRDLKPSNILVDTNCTTKLCDFGLARSLASAVFDQFDPTMTEYVATRWYRSPEILLGSKKYTKGVDIWSIGCILGEIITGKPIFPGTCSLNQVQIILQALPEVTSEDISAIDGQYSYSLLVGTLSKTKKDHSLAERLKNADTNALEMIKKLLVFNPENRITASAALEQEYVKIFREPEKEVVMTKDVKVDDNDQIDIKNYQTKIVRLFPENPTVPKSEIKSKSKISSDGPTMEEIQGKGIYCINHQPSRRKSTLVFAKPEIRPNRGVYGKQGPLGNRRADLQTKTSLDYGTISAKALNELKGKFNI